MAISFTVETDGRLAGGQTLLAGRHRELVPGLPALAIVGGCCGTAARHVSALWNEAG